MAITTSTTPAPSRRRRASLSASASPILPVIVGRRSLPLPAATAPALPLALPLSADRAFIEALVSSLIDWLDAQDAPQSDMEPDHGGEEEADENSAQPLPLSLPTSRRIAPVARRIAA